jgi:hypothetical protein
VKQTAKQTLHGLENRAGCSGFGMLSQNFRGKATAVQKIGWILAVLCALCWIASDINLPGEPQAAPAQNESIWRRTADGWENVNDWTFAIEKSPPVLHPGVMALLMVILSLSIGIVKMEPTN